MQRKATFINRADVPVILQREPQECGAAALAMIASFYGKTITWKELLSETINEKGICSAGALVRSAKRHNFEAHGYKKDTMKLCGMEMPCILHWNYNNFVVLEGFENDDVYVIDPSCGRKVISFEELSDSFTGIVLTVRPNE